MNASPSDRHRSKPRAATGVLTRSAPARLIPYRHFRSPMGERVPVAEFRILPGMGHVPVPDDPALVARTILELTRAAASGDLST